MFLHLLYVAMCDKLYIILIFISRKIYYFLSSSPHKSLTIRGTQFLLRREGGGGRNFKNTFHGENLKKENLLHLSLKVWSWKGSMDPSPIPLIFCYPLFKVSCPWEMRRGKWQEKDKSISSLKLFYLISMSRLVIICSFLCFYVSHVVSMATVRFDYGYNMKVW